MKNELSCCSKRSCSVWPARPWSNDVTSKDRLFGPSWISGSPGLVEYIVWRTVPLASRIWARNSWDVVRKAPAKFWMRSDQLSVAWVTVAGTTNDWVMLFIAGPVGLVTASKLPEMGGWGVAALAG